MDKYIYIHRHSSRKSCRLAWKRELFGFLVTVWFQVCVCALSLSCSTLCDPMDCSSPARPLCPWGFSRQEYWKGLPCPYIMRLNKFPQLFIDEIQNRIIIKEYNFLQCRSSDEKNGNFFFLVYLMFCLWWVFIAARGFSWVVVSRDYSLLQWTGFLLWWLLLLLSTGSRSVGLVAVHGLSCSTACGIFLDQGLNPCPLHRQVFS